MKYAGGAFMFLFLVACFAAAGAFIALRPSEAERQAAIAHQAEVHELRMERAEALEPWERGFRIGAMAILLVALAGVGYGLTRLLVRRANTIYADAHGIFPVIRGRVGGAAYIHDPNRAPTPCTLYRADDTAGASVTHVLPKGMEGDQLQITSQAQVVQAVRAGVSGTGLDDMIQGAIREMVDGDGRRLPQVRRVEVPEGVMRLLEQDERNDGLDF